MITGLPKMISKAFYCTSPKINVSPYYFIITYSFIEHYSIFQAFYIILKLKFLPEQTNNIFAQTTTTDCVQGKRSPEASVFPDLANGSYLRQREWNNYMHH